MSGLKDVLTWAETFPAYEARNGYPRASLPTRHGLRVKAGSRRFVWPGNGSSSHARNGRVHGDIVLGWLGSLAGISPDWSAIVRNPSVVYYEGEAAVNRAYDGAVRAYYRSPLVRD